MALRKHLSYANVMATIAVFIALGGGAYAVNLKRNSVGPKQLKANAVDGSKVADGSLKGADVADGSLGGGELAAGAVGDREASNPVLSGFAGITASSNCDLTTRSFCGVTGAGWTQPIGLLGYLAYTVDNEGFVHLQGAARCVGVCPQDILTLPIELAPAGLGDDGLLDFVVAKNAFTTQTAYVQVETSDPGADRVRVGLDISAVAADQISLSGISWRTN